MWLFIVAVGVVLASYLIYQYFLAPEKNFWGQYNIRQIDASHQVSKISVILGRKGMAEGDAYIYSLLSPSEKFCGFMEMNNPFLLIKDLDLVKRVLIKDFDHFVDRRKFFTKKHGLLGRMLVNLEGEEWKGVRSAISPTFTTGKIRRMMDIFNSVGIEWVEEFTRKAKSSKEGSVIIDVGKASGQYTVDVISSAVFGMKSDSIKNPDSAFGKMVAHLVDFMNLKALIKFGLVLYFPWITQKFGIVPMDGTALSFFEDIFKKELKSRLRGATKRNDFIQLLVEAKKGELKAFGNDELDEFEKDAEIKMKGESDKKQWLTEEIMNAQSVMFFFVGFTTTSNLIQFVLYALALNQNVQEKLRKEVKKLIKKDGTFDYDEIGKAAYLDMVVSGKVAEVNCFFLLFETLRLFPGGGRLERLCVREFRDAELGLVIPKGAVVAIPVESLHCSEEFFEKPNEFYPEHFTAETKAARNPYCYLPFGSGPRNCVGMRFAQIEVKSAVAHIVHNFLIEPTSKTQVPLQGRPIGFNKVAPKDLELKLTPLSN